MTILLIEDTVCIKVNSNEYGFFVILGVFDEVRNRIGVGGVET